jgi:hypothetical protein
VYLLSAISEQPRLLSILCGLDRRAFNASIDVALQKKIRVTEGQALQVPIEVSNLTNRVNFGLPVTDLVSSDFGRSREAGTARTIRFRLGYAF